MIIYGQGAIVTGVASGLGAATALSLVEQGAKVFGFDLPFSIEQSDRIKGVTYCAVDVTDESQVAEGITMIGETPLRLAVNCAGVAPAKRTLTSQGPHDLATFRRTVDINLVGTFNVIRLAAQAMSKTESDEQGQRGLIVNTASVAAYEGQIGQIAYAASKGGVVAMTIAAARDLARNGIRVNTIAPGIVDTPMLASLGPEVCASLAASVPFPKRLARRDEYAQLVQFFIMNDYINGETVRLDGALRMAPQ